MRNTYSIFIGKPVGKNYSEDLEVEGEKILECVLEK
jgi:hypothetical protein